MQSSTSKEIKNELNRTGLFLESVVFESLQKLPKFKVTREEPYTSEGFEGTIDIPAVSQVRKDLLVCIPIECKKADPEQKYWVFDQRKKSEKPTFPFDFYEVAKSDINYDKNVFFPSLDYPRMEHLDKAIQSFEFNETTGKISRNKEQRPYLALKQANEAVSSFIDEKRRRIYEISDVNYNQANIIFIPLVVTTANLHILEYKPSDIDWRSGTIKTSELGLRAKEWVHYEFPLPYSLRTRTSPGLGPVKRPSFIVNSDEFVRFITRLVKDCGNYIPDT